MPAIAVAQPDASARETARTLMEQGDAAFERKDYARALEAYQTAHDLVRVPTTGLAVARAQARLGRLAEARDAALAVVRMPKSPDEPAPFVSARAEADQLATELAPRIPSLTISVEGAPRDRVRVTVDGKVLPSKLVGIPSKVNPGKHVVVASAPGFSEARGEITLAEAASETLPLRLSPTGAPAAAGAAPSGAGTSGQRGMSPLVYVGFGVGAAGIVVGSVTGVMSLSKASAVGDECDGNTCPRSAEDDADTSKTLANVSNVAFGVGLVGIGVGIYALLSSGTERSEPSARSKPRAARVQPVIGAGFVGVEGSF